jgi:hypothetical protein
MMRFMAFSSPRELRDRWLEHINSDASAIASNGKYDVSRALGAPAPGRKAAPFLGGIAA